MPKIRQSRASGVMIASSKSTMHAAGDMAESPKLMPRDTPLMPSTKANSAIAAATAAAL